jgi:S-adenosylmethionine hydrolase
MGGIITLTTDFGTRDPYVGAMKGVILGIDPDARLVDISHDVPCQDVAAGAFVLSGAYRYFPPGTVHVAVVDPGVGTARRGIVVETQTWLFVGPDNGLFTPVYSAEDVGRIVEIRNPEAMLPEVSSTFHGRDVFAPTAAHLCAGLPLESVGPPVDDPVRLDLWEEGREPGRMTGRIVHVDRFGNGITALTRDRIEGATGGRTFRVSVGGQTFGRVSQTYGDAAQGEPLVLFGSRGTLELSVNGGNAAELMGFGRGDEVVVAWEEGER